MLHGNKERFAVQWKLEPDPLGHLMCGTICFWIGNRKIGEDNFSTYLTFVLGELAYPVGDCGNRRSDRFCQATAPEVITTLRSALLGYDDSLSELAYEETWARFNISIDVDVLDSWQLYLIDCDGYSRLLVSRCLAGSPELEFELEERLAVGEYDAVIKEFQRELEATQQGFLDTAN